MTSYKITFSGTDEQLLAGAIENGYTGFKPVPYKEITLPEDITPPEPETVDEFMCRILMTVSPNTFIHIAVTGLQNKKGSENYNGQAMGDAMLGLLSIEHLVL